MELFPEIINVNYFCKKNSIIDVKYFDEIGSGGMEILLGGGFFLPEEGNLRRSGLDDSNLFQS